MSQRIHAFALCWNEERFLPYFLRHYSRFCERITIWDNESTDRSAEIASSVPGVSIVPLSTGGEVRDDVWVDFKNTCWQKSRDADWVMVVDVDEIVYHRHLTDYLADCTSRGVTLPWTTGYEMVAKCFPTSSGQIYEEVVEGVRDDWYSKPAVFDPQAIDEINYVPGAHSCQPTGRVVEERSPDLKLLHYRFLGLDYVVDRFEGRRRRQSAINTEKGWGTHFQKKPRELKRWYRDVAKRSHAVV